MALVCSISNEVPEVPVLSTVSGHVFEKRLITKYINERGTDPISNQPLSLEQLIDVKVNPLVKPKAPSATSIPALLKSLQDEWDSVMLHSFTLRQQLQTARQELSHSLYQHDAACRVIARLTKELTAAREALATLKPQATSTNGGPTQTMYAAETMSNGDEAKVQVEEGINEEVSQRLQEKSTVLTQMRKQKGKNLPDDLATVEDVKSYQMSASHVGLHSASVPGITTMDVKFSDPNLIVTGGNDKSVVVFNNQTEQILSTFKGHTKKITQVIYHPDEDVVVSSSADSTIRVWSVRSNQQTLNLKVHESAVTGLSLHPLGDYLLSCSLDEHWVFSDIRSGKMLLKVSSAASTQSADGEQTIGGNSIALTAAKFHPDGLILATGTADSIIKIWDLKSKTNLANFPGHSGQIVALSFSENGYYLASAAEDSTVKLWDLRKLKNFKTLEFEGNHEIKDLVFDYSGVYLACAGTDVRIYQTKPWELISTLSDHTNMVTGVRFGTNAKQLFTCSMDKSLKSYKV